MMKKDISLILTSLLILSNLFCLKAQETPPRWQVGVHSGLFIAITRTNEKNDLGVYSKDLQNYEADMEKSFFLLSDIAIAVDVNYTVLPFLRANFNFAYSGLANTQVQNIRTSLNDQVVARQSDVKYSRTSLNACFDLLYQDPFESLNFIVGLGYNHLYNRVSFVDIAGQNAEQKYIINGFTRTMRQVRYFNLNLAAEWRDYITPHFGYFIRLGYVPLTQANTHSILLEKVQINGQTHPLEGETLKPGENGLPQENYEFQFINLSLGLTYQW
jgi:hypothetical protein